MMKYRTISYLIAFLLTSHWLYAQQPMRKDTCQTVPKQEQTKPVEPLDSTKFKKCTLCNGRGTIRKEVRLGHVISKGRRECVLCGEEYGDSIRHYHEERSKMCHGLGYRWKKWLLIASSKRRGYRLRLFSV